MTISGLGLYTRPVGSLHRDLQNIRGLQSFEQCDPDLADAAQADHQDPGYWVNDVTLIFLVLSIHLFKKALKLQFIHAMT